MHQGLYELYGSSEILSLARKTTKTVSRDSFRNRSSLSPGGASYPSLFAREHTL